MVGSVLQRRHCMACACRRRLSALTQGQFEGWLAGWGLLVVVSVLICAMCAIFPVLASLAWANTTVTVGIQSFVVLGASAQLIVQK
jgi:hypothetical protein